MASRVWFEEEDAAALSARLGRISKFQALRSEDAPARSWFGTLASAAPEERRAALGWLFARLEIGVSGSATASIRLWERVYQPNAPSSRSGPEVDAIVDDPGSALIYAEAKWLPGLGTGKGSSEGRLDDQIVFRRDSLNGPSPRRR